MNYVYNLRECLAQKFNENIYSYKALTMNTNYINIQASIYKLVCLRNIISKEIKKKVLFLFDLNNKYIRDNVFKEIMFSYFRSYSEEIKSNNFEYTFCAFDDRLHLQFEPILSDEFTQGRKFAKNYVTVINKDKNGPQNNKGNIEDSNDVGSNNILNNNIGKNISLTSQKENNNININFNIKININ